MAQQVNKPNIIQVWFAKVSTTQGQKLSPYRKQLLILL